MALEAKTGKLLGSMMTGLAGGDEDEAVQKTLDEASASIVEAGVIGTSAMTDLKAGNLSISTYRDNKAANAGLIKLTKALTAKSTLATMALKSKPVVNESAAKIGGFDLTSVAMDYDFDKVVAALPEETRAAQKAMLEKMSGGSKQTMWFGTDGKVVVTLTAKDADAVKALLETYVGGKGTLEGDKAFAATRKNLPAQATFLMLLETGRTVEMGSDLMKEVGNLQPGALPIQIPELKAPKGEASYIGIALTLKPKHGIIDFFIPAAAVGTVRRMVGPVIND